MLKVNQAQEGSQGSQEDLELKSKLAKSVNQGSDLENPVKLGEGRPDLGKGSDAEKNPPVRGVRDRDEKSADKAVEKADKKA